MDGGIAFLDGKVVLHPGDCREVLRGIPDASIDSVVTDPPYALVSIGKRFGKPGSAPTKDGDVYSRASAGFMGQQWDTGETAFAAEFWAQVLRVLKPGGHIVAFSGTRTYHRMVCAIEDAGFDIRDQLAWVYGSGFPKSHDVSKAIDKHLGFERAKVRVERVRNPKATGGGRDGLSGATRPYIERALELGYHEAVSDEAVSWQGWGTALKPAWEPIVLARKPLAGTVAETVVQHGTGALNIDRCRVGMSADDAARIDGRVYVGSPPSHSIGRFASEGSDKTMVAHPAGRWPANIVHDGSAEVLAGFPQTESGTGAVKRASGEGYRGNALGAESRPAGTPMISHGDSGSAARFFYSAKADAYDRIGSKHPTVKPVDLMEWLCRLVTPPGGVILDPFAGSGTTGEAAFRQGFRSVLIEREPQFQADIARRMELALAGPATRKAEIVKARAKDEEPLPLFADGEAA